MIYESVKGLSEAELREALAASIEGKDLKKVLIIPPDYTRMYSGAGDITRIYYDLLKDTCEIDILPALGTHVPMTKEECTAFFGPDVPFDRILVHNWKTDVVKIGEVPAEFVSEAVRRVTDKPVLTVPYTVEAPYEEAFDRNHFHLPEDRFAF